MSNSPKRSIREKYKPLAKLDLKNDADTDTPSVSANFNIYPWLILKKILLTL